MSVAGTVEAKDILPVQAQVQVKAKRKDRDAAIKLSHCFTFRNCGLRNHSALQVDNRQF